MHSNWDLLYFIEKLRSTNMLETALSGISHYNQEFYASCKPAFNL